MARVLTVLCVLAAVVGCSGKKEAAPGGDGNLPSPRDGAVSTSGDGGSAQVPRTGTGAVAGDAGAPNAPKVPLVPRADVEAALAKWLESQNAGDFSAYQALYAEGFKGIRRSGKQTVRLDRAGWLKDRKKMFAKPMLVAANDVEIVIGRGDATVRFIQEWSSGNYHDVGPKEIRFEVHAGELRIIREEMLRSEVVRPSREVSTDLPIWPVHERRVVLSDTVEARWATGDPSLMSGRVPEHDPTCEEDPPDYEADQQRYWECESTDPHTAHDTFVATQSVDPSAVPAPLRAWVGQKVRLGGGAATCTATVSRLVLYAERRTTVRAVAGDDADDEAIAREVLRTGNPVLVAELRGGCDARWAQLADRAEPVVWTIERAPDGLRDAALERADTGVDRDTAPDGDGFLVRGPDGRGFVVVIADESNCGEPTGFAAAFALNGSAITGDAVMESWEPTTLVAAVDSDGDGAPELVFDDGVAVLVDGEFDVRRMLDFPNEVSDCGD